MDRIVLRQNNPNPFNPATTIRFGLLSEGRVTLRVYDVGGRLIRTLVDGKRPPGWYEAVWNGLDQSGRSVASGVYFCRLRMGDLGKTRKMVLLR
jgi:hypothetical protein